MAVSLNTDAALIESVGWTKKQSPRKTINEIYCSWYVGEEFNSRE